MEFHENYVTYHEKRARELIKDPKTNNPLLKKALFYKDARAAIARSEEEAKGNKSLQFSSINLCLQPVKFLAADNLCQISPLLLAQASPVPQIMPQLDKTKEEGLQIH